MLVWLFDVRDVCLTRVRSTFYPSYQLLAPNVLVYRKWVRIVRPLLVKNPEVSAPTFFIAFFAHPLFSSSLFTLHTQQPTKFNHNIAKEIEKILFYVLSISLVSLNCLNIPALLQLLYILDHVIVFCLFFSFRFVC